MRWIIYTFVFKSQLTSQETVLYPHLTSLRVWEQLLSVILMLVALCSLFDQSSPIKCFLVFCMTVNYSPQWSLVSVSNKQQTCMRSDNIETNSWNNKVMSWHTILLTRAVIFLVSAKAKTESSGWSRSKQKISKLSQISLA